MTFYFLKLIEKEDSGLCNQIYNMAGMLDYSFDNKIKYIFVGSFLKQIYTQNMCNSGEIFDFDEMNKYFGQKYGVYYFDGNTYKTKITITYYNDSQTNNITEYMLDKYLDTQGNLFIPKNTEFENICDTQNITKHYIKCNYFINNYEFNTTYELNNFKIDENVHLCLKVNENKKDTFINSKTNREHQCKNIEFFWDTLANVLFQPLIVMKSQTYYRFLKIKYNIKESDKINCIHLRLENDMIDCLSKEENVSFEYCKEVLEQKYIYIIQTSFDKNDIIIILANEFNNKVIEFLNLNGYKYILSENLHKDREICASMDLVLGQISCNNIYLGYYQSTFSYTLFYKLKINASKFLFITHHIKDKMNKEFIGFEKIVNKTTEKANT
jgi:hypothetical protein